MKPSGRTEYITPLFFFFN